MNQQERDKKDRKKERNIHLMGLEVLDIYPKKIHPLKTAELTFCIYYFHFFWYLQLKVLEQLKCLEKSKEKMSLVSTLHIYIHIYKLFVTKVAYNYIIMQTSASLKISMLNMLHQVYYK